MAAKVPIRTVYNSDDVATGLAEFQAADFISLANGGTGASLSIGSAGQVLRVNSGATALEFASKEDLADITSIGSTLTAPSNADFTITTAGTGNIVLNDLSISDNKIHANRSNDDLIITASGTGNVVIGAVTINGTTISSADSTKVTIAEALDVTGAVTITSGTITGITDITVADGGTGASTFTDGGVLLGSGTGAITAMAELSDGQMIVGDGSGDPVAESGATLRTSIGVGTGDSPQFTGIELGHATDTTITKASSGDLNIEGNIIYRAGGTDVPVADGGTGTGSHTSTAILLGNGTSSIQSSEIKITGSSLFTGDSSAININEGLIVDGTASFSGAVTITSGTITGITDITVADGGTGASTLTDNAVLTGTGSSAITAEGNLSFNGSTLAVTGAATVSTTLGVTGASTLDGVTVTDNTISSNASNSNLEISANGSGKISLSGLLFPTSDGSNGQALVTDGAGTLSFGTVSGNSASDDSTAVKKLDKHITSTARVVDAWHETFIDSALYYLVTSDHVNEQISLNKVTVCHNDTTSFYAEQGTSSDGTVGPTIATDISNSMVRLKVTATGATGRMSYLKYGLGDNSSAATSGNTEIVINADVDSASESLDSFAHASYRGAKYCISVNNNAKTEVGNIEAMVVHDGTTAYITSYNEIFSGSNSLITLTAAIDGSNVVVSAAGGEANLRVTVHAIRLKDTMVSDDGTYDHTESIAPVTVSSTATEVDTLVEEPSNAAVYYFVRKNASEGEYAVNEVMVCFSSDEVGVTSAGFVSTKDTNQLTFSASYKDDAENTMSVKAASTSGGSTTVSAYRINLLAK